jgi:hypothetical protein
LHQEADVSAFNLTQAAVDRTLGTVLRGRYDVSVDLVPTALWVELGTIVPGGNGAVLAIDATEPLRVAVKNGALTGGASLEGYSLPTGARDTLYLEPGNRVFIRTP